MRQLKITSSITNRDGSTIEKYFTEVSREPMVTAEEEVILAQRIKQGDHAALERLVKANLRFVVSVAKQYQHGKIPLNDLINEGNLGLIKAAKMFDETRGFKFISYAVWWIRQSIMQALAEHSRLVRIPVNKVAELSKIKNAASIIEQKSEREASPDELADFLQISVDDIRNIQVAAIRQSSLDAPFDEDNGNSLIDVLTNPNSDATDKLLDGNSSLKIEMERLLTLLNEREKDVVKRFFGIGYDYSFTLEDIAADLKLTRERVRQIKENALKKLNFEANMKLLKPYLCAC